MSYYYYNGAQNPNTRYNQNGGNYYEDYWQNSLGNNSVPLNNPANFGGNDSNNWMNGWNNYTNGMPTSNNIYYDYGNPQYNNNQYYNPYNTNPYASMGGNYASDPMMMMMQMLLDMINKQSSSSQNNNSNGNSNNNTSNTSNGTSNNSNVYYGAKASDTVSGVNNLLKASRDKEKETPPNLQGASDILRNAQNLAEQTVGKSSNGRFDFEELRKLLNGIDTDEQKNKLMGQMLRSSPYPVQQFIASDYLKNDNSKINELIANKPDKKQNWQGLKTQDVGDAVENTLSQGRNTNDSTMKNNLYTNAAMMAESTIKQKPDGTGDFSEYKKLLESLPSKELSSLISKEAEVGGKEVNDFLVKEYFDGDYGKYAALVAEGKKW